MIRTGVTGADRLCFAFLKQMPGTACVHVMYLSNYVCGRAVQVVAVVLRIFGWLERFYNF